MKQTTQNPKLFLIDGNSLAYRAFYALPDSMKSASGVTTNAIYGFTTMLLKILEEKPDSMAIAFDRPEPTFRHKEYKEYKATRQKAPPTLFEQLPYVREIAAAFDIPIFEQPGFEADDLIGTLAKEAEKKGYAVEILSGDLDPLQLVNENIKLLSLRKGITDTVLYGKKEVIERYGLEPGQMIDFKALKGDASDNIPGVPKVGEKISVELLKAFGTLENIYQHLDEIKKPALQQNLRQNLPLAEMSKRLATIKTDIPLEIDFSSFKRKEVDWEKVLPLFEKFEFESLVKKYSKGVDSYQAENLIHKKREEISKLNFKGVFSEKEFEGLLHKIARSDKFAFDLETTGLDTFADEIVGISFSFESKAAYYLPLGHTGNRDGKEQVSAPFALEKLRPFFLSDKLKIGHNLKFDLKILNNAGLEVNGPFFDTMVAAYLLDPTSGKYSLKHLGRQFLGKEMIKMVELIGEEAQYKNFAEVPLDLAVDYAGSDAEATFGLFEIFSLALKGQKMDRLFQEVEMPLLTVLIKMEESGIHLDCGLLGRLSLEIEKELKELERHIFALAGGTFNLNSPKQLSAILFEKLMLPVLKRTKTGPSTDAEVLEELAGQNFEIAEKLLGYRQLNKLKNTYIDVLPKLVHPKTGRLHTSYNQTITATGRLSSSDPNLQNIPAKGEWGKKIRCAFVPEKKDWLILTADYSQIELRILAHLSQDPELVRAFQEKKDVHQATADELGISRDAAKTVNFGIIYGISDFGLAKSLKIKKTEAAIFIEKYFTTYKGVKHFIEKTIRDAKENGYVTTLLGRKRPMPDINSPHAGIKAAAERMAINAPVQGSAADMIKVAMVNIFSKFHTLKCVELKPIQSQMILQVHDELVFECPKEEAAQIEKIVREEMEKALSLDVPVKVDLGSGRSWAQQEALA